MRKFSRAVAFQFLGFILVGLILFWISRHLPIVEMITKAQHRIGQMEWWGAVFYPLLIVGCNLLLLPGGILAIGSGLLFGLWWGFFLVWIGTILGAAVAFFASRKLGRQWVERFAKKRQRWMRLDDAIAKEGWKIIFLTQVHPLFPTSLLNYIYGITRIRFWPCMAWIAVGQAPGLFLYSYLGTLTQHGIKLIRGKSHPYPMEYAVWLGGLLITVIVTTALGRIAIRLLREIQEEPAECEQESVGRESRP